MVLLVEFEHIFKTGSADSTDNRGESLLVRGVAQCLDSHQLVVQLVAKLTIHHLIVFVVSLD